MLWGFTAESLIGAESGPGVSPQWQGGVGGVFEGPLRGMNGTRGFLPGGEGSLIAAGCDSGAVSRG